MSDRFQIKIEIKELKMKSKLCENNRD